jgi:hypothetical protein
MIDPFILLKSLVVPKSPVVLALVVLTIANGDNCKGRHVEISALCRLDDNIDQQEGLDSDSESSILSYEGDADDIRRAAEPRKRETKTAVEAARASYRHLECERWPGMQGQTVKREIGQEVLR